MADVVAKFSLKNENMNAKFNLNEGNAVDAIFKIDAAGTTWGSIDGDIANQTDLYNILNAKANQSELDSLSETVSNNYTALENEINGLSTVVDNNYSETIERFENDELAVSNLTNTVSNNYTELDNKILTNSTHITSISDTINSFGDIVTYNASNFATSAQGALADTALQPNDNISELVNNIGYITSASLPVVNNGTLTIRANGETVGTFNANQAEDTTVEISIPDSATWGNITGNIQNQTDLVNALNDKQDNLTAQDGITLNNNIISGKPLEDAIGDIDELIPVQATAQNQLADKNFVNSSIATNTANFIGTFNSVAELEAYSGTLTNNDYAFVSTIDSAGNTLYDRYKWNGSEWLFEYELNNSSFTAAQWASINSGITSGDVSLISTAIQPNDNISELTNDAGYITSASLPTVNNSNITLQKNGIDVGSFTLNQSSNNTINFSIPTDTSDLTNNAGFITASSIPTVDQTYSPSSTNAQSGKAINGAGFLQNTATGNSSITVNGTATAKSQSINIGTGSQATGNYGTALGAYSFGNASHALGLGNYAKATADYAIQLNKGTNNTSNSLCVGFNSDNYQLLDGTTGLIPDARLSSNIARTSQIPSAVTESTVSDWGFTKNTGTVTSVNNVSPVSGNVTLSIPTATSDLTNDSGYITSSDLPTNYVTTDTTQNITGTKTFIGQKKIAFKQSGTSDKLGFTLYNNSGTEKGYLEYNPSNNVDGVPLMTLGNYATASGGLTHVGFRKYSSISGASGAYNLLTPLISDAKTPFSLTTTYTNFYLPLGFTDGNTTVKTAKSGMVDLSSIIPTATSDLTNDSGFITSIPTATSSTLGMVQPDNTTITIDSNGVISSNVASRNVGEIIQSTIPLTDAGLHLLDGSLILGGGIYQGFVDYIADLYTENPTANYFTDETTWQNSVTTYGVCGKFVYDSVNNTVRLPKVSNILQGTTDLNALGSLVEAGLPVHTHTRGTMNITGSLNSGSSRLISGGTQEGNVDGVGAFNSSFAWGIGGFGNGNGYANAHNISFDASKSWTGSTSNPNYTNNIQNSSTVQPQTIKCFVYIVIANSTKTSIQVDIDEIATDLNGKADVDGTNMVSSVKNFDGQWVTIDSNNQIADTVTWNNTVSEAIYDISSYLPNDNYNYEVLITALVQTAATTQKFVAVQLTSDIFTSVYVVGTRAAGNIATTANGNAIIPVGTARTITQYTSTSSNANGTYSLWIKGYRRIGTNS